MFKLFDFIKSDLIRYVLGKYVSFFIQYITNKISSWQSAFRFEQTEGAIRLVEMGYLAAEAWQSRRGDEALQISVEC